MNLFQNVKATVTVQQAAEYYGQRVVGNGMIRCPFHNDRTPSMKLNMNYFYCFGCGSSGDVIDFVGRLFGLSAYNAARKLANDFGLNPGKCSTASPPPKSQYQKKAAFREGELLCRRTLNNYLHVLLNWKTQYAPVSPEDEFDNRFVEACRMSEHIEHLTDILAVGDLPQRAKIVETLLKDGMIDKLRKRLERLNGKEIVDDGKRQ